MSRAFSASSAYTYADFQQQQHRQHHAHSGTPPNYQHPPSLHAEHHQQQPIPQPPYVLTADRQNDHHHHASPPSHVSTSPTVPPSSIYSAVASVAAVAAVAATTATTATRIRPAIPALAVVAAHPFHRTNRTPPIVAQCVSNSYPYSAAATTAAPLPALLYPQPPQYRSQSTSSSSSTSTPPSSVASASPSSSHSSYSPHLSYPNYSVPSSSSAYAPPPPASTPSGFDSALAAPLPRLPDLSNGYPVAPLSAQPSHSYHHASHPSPAPAYASTNHHHHHGPVMSPPPRHPIDLASSSLPSSSHVDDASREGFSYTSAHDALFSSSPPDVLDGHAPTDPLHFSSFPPPAFSSSSAVPSSASLSSSSSSSSLHAPLFPSTSSSSFATPVCAVHWFRKGLRVHDNPCLVEAASFVTQLHQQHVAAHLYCLFFIDPQYLRVSPVGPNRWRFLLECLHDLDQQLRARGSRLVVLHGDPVQVFPKLFKMWNVQLLTHEHDTEMYTRKRDHAVKQAADAAGVRVHIQHTHLLYNVDQVLKLNHGICPMSQGGFEGLVSKLPKPSLPVPAPDALPLFDEALQGHAYWRGWVGDAWGRDWSVPSLADLGLPRPPLPPHPLSPLDPNYHQRANQASTSSSASTSNGTQSGGGGGTRQTRVDSFFARPSTSVTTTTAAAKAAYPHAARPAFGDHSYFLGGETEALRRLDEYLSDPNVVCNFEKPKTSPTDLVPSTTTLSPYLKFGTLSVRVFYHRLLAVYANRQHTKPPVSLLGQLLWREFFYHASYSIPNFDRMANNPTCRQIPWEQSSGPNDPHDDPQRKHEFLACWREARTGFPWIDACMRQLRLHGWLHHLARHSVACFFTRGDLWMHWERGRDYFYETLVDEDWALNNANWQWLSASAFFHQYWRIYHPATFCKHTDKEGKFIRHFIPELRRMPTKYIFQPHLAPLSVQQQAGCIIGKDYPSPIVDHNEVSKLNMAKMKHAYESKVPLVLPQVQATAAQGALPATGPALPFVARGFGVIRDDETGESGMEATDQQVEDGNQYLLTTPQPSRNPARHITASVVLHHAPGNPLITMSSGGAVTDSVQSSSSGNGTTKKTKQKEVATKAKTKSATAAAAARKNKDAANHESTRGKRKRSASVSEKSSNRRAAKKPNRSARSDEDEEQDEESEDEESEDEEGEDVASGSDSS